MAAGYFASARNDTISEVTPKTAVNFWIPKDKVGQMLRLNSPDPVVP